MARLLLLIVALILYGSLFPWDFRFPPPGQGPLSILLGNSPTEIDRFAIRDLGVNLLLYLPLGAAGFLALARRYRPAVAMAATVGIGAALSIAAELLQIFTPSRTPSMFDIVCNVLGTVAGVWLAAGFRPQIGRAMARPAGKWRSSPGAFVLLAIWGCFQLYPLFPAFGSYQLLGRLRELAGSGWSPLETLYATAEWLTAGLLLEAVVGARLARSRFPILLLAVPARLLIAWRGPALSDFVGAAAALALLYALPAAPGVRYKAGAAILAISLVVRGTAPFHLSPAFNSFTWPPFAGILNAHWSTATLLLLRKTYDYGSAVWMLRMSGMRFRPAAAVVTISLAVLEVVQLRLPGRTPELTDPFLALLTSVAIVWLERDAEQGDSARHRSARFG